MTIASETMTSVERLMNQFADTPEGNATLRREIRQLATQVNRAPAYGVFPGNETAAEQHARRYYPGNHFMNQAFAERAYFRVLVDSLTRGQRIRRLQARLGKAREKARALACINADLRKQLAALVADAGVGGSNGR